MIFKSITKKQAEAKLYGYIGVWFTNGDTFTQLLEDVEAKGHTELIIRMHCYGGSVFEGNLMFNAMQRSSLKITIIVEGVAASMGCFILPATEFVEIAENAFGMIHRPNAMVDGDVDQLEAQVKLLRDMENNFISLLVNKTGKTADEIKSKYLNGSDNWLNATEMVELGLAKKVIPSVVKSIKDLDKDIVAKMEIEKIYGKYAAVLDINTNQNQKSIMNLALIIATFSLEGLTTESSEAEVLAALKAKFDGLQTQLTNIQNEARLKSENAIKAMLDEAVTSGKIKTLPGQTIDQVRAMYESIGKKSGIEALQTVLGSIQKTTPLAHLIVQEGSASATAGVENWGWFQKNDPQALVKMQAENPAQFKELYNAEYGVYPEM